MIDNRYKQHTKIALANSTYPEVNFITSNMKLVKFNHITRRVLCPPSVNLIFKGRTKNETINSSEGIGLNPRL